MGDKSFAVGDVPQFTTCTVGAIRHPKHGPMVLVSLFIEGKLAGVMAMPPHGTKLLAEDFKQAANRAKRGKFDGEFVAAQPTG